MWMLKVDSSSEFLLQQLLIFRNDTSRWFIKHTFRVWSKLQFCIFVIFLSIVPFHLVFVVASKIKFITFYCSHFEWPEHYSNVKMSAMASQIISLTIVYWIVYSGADQRKYQSSASLAFVRGIHRQVKFGGSGIFFRTHGRNGLKFDMLMYPDHLWNWLHSGHGQLIFLILAPFLLSETGQMCSFQAFSWQCMGGIGWN